MWASGEIGRRSGSRGPQHSDPARVHGLVCGKLDCTYTGSSPVSPVCLNLLECQYNRGVNTCAKCNREYEYSRQAGHRSTVCNSCQVKYKRKQMKEKAVAYKGGACLTCGYNKCMRALEFHHLDPSQKELKISDHTLKAWSKILAELDKCVLLCAVCHVEVHEGIRIVPGSPNW